MTDGRAWEERAVKRSLRSARERAVSRSERFVAAGTELLLETGTLEFTVQELVERAQLSLRSFYQHFASKDELLLAVFEEAVGSYVAHLRDEVRACADPAEQLRRYVTSFYEAGRSSDRRASAALSRYLLNLRQADPSELARVFEPQISLLREIIDAGAASGYVRSDVAPSVLTLLVTNTLMSSVEMQVLGVHLTGDRVSGEELLAFCTAGVTARR